MKNLLIILIFIIVLFFYLHIIYHLKKSNDLEVYEINEPTKNELEEICNYRQPVIFYYNSNLSEDINNEQIITKYSSFDLNVRNVKNNNTEQEMYIPYKVKDLFSVFENDNIFSGKVRHVHIPIERALDIDTLFDFKIAELLLSKE